MQEDFFKNLFNYTILADIKKKVQDEDVANFLQTQNTFPTTTQYHSFIEQRAIDDFAKINANSFYKDFDNDDFLLAKQYVSNMIHEICNSSIIPDYQNGALPFGQPLIDSLIDLFAIYICKESTLDTYTGVVIAGYGDDEFYPVVKSNHIFGIFNSKLMRPAREDQSNSGAHSGIMPFAQDDEVHTFMKGCSKGTQNCINDSLHNAFENIKTEVTNIISSQIQNLNRTVIENAFDSVIPNQKAFTHAMIENHANQNHIQKVLSILDSLAKVDLGYMAESLVNLTAFKRKVSNDSDSVGGPIDVAVLSKGDGFVWLKRKHYFDKDLNYRFFSRN